MAFRFSSIARASAAAAFVVVNIAGTCDAATNLNSSRSNVYKAISTPADEAACVKAAGSVVIRDGKKVCSMPAPAPE